MSVDGEAVLAPADFTARVDGVKNTRVVRVLTPGDDLLLLVVTDFVGDLATVEPARKSLVAQAEQLPPNAHLALLRAQDGLRVVLDPTNDREAFASTLASIPIAGSAGLLDTVETASRIADAVARKSGVRVAVLYVTDSDVRKYREDFTNPVINSSDSRDLSRRFPEGLIREKIARVEKLLNRFQTPIFIVHIAYSSERLNQAYQAGLARLARATGGIATFCRSRAEIPDSIALATDQAAKQYRVYVELPPDPPKAITLSLSSAGRNLNFRSRYLMK